METITKDCRGTGSVVGKGALGQRATLTGGPLLQVKYTKYHHNLFTTLVHECSQ